MKHGLVQVYTGNGKGKTTSSVGLVCRAIHHKFKVCYIHLCKNPEKWQYGEISTLKKLGVTVYGFAVKYPYFHKNVTIDQVKTECNKALQFINKVMKGGKYDIVVLDEILVAVSQGYLLESAVLDLIKNKPESVELVLTGRGATKRIIESADLVSEIKEIKHPYKKGMIGRKGIEF
jgi:cob(I)alamin adenosyltransferase